MKKKINIPLIITTIAIWGFIVYSVMQAVWFNVEETEIQEEPGFNYSKNNKQSEGNVEFKIEILDNDPFKSSAKIHHDETIREEPEQIQQRYSDPPINFSVSGVVINGSSKKIVFNDNTHSNIVFLEEGDIYQNLKVIKISKSQVEFLQLGSGSKLVSEIQ